MQTVTPWLPSILALLVALAALVLSVLALRQARRMSERPRPTHPPGEDSVAEPRIATAEPRPDLPEFAWRDGGIPEGLAEWIQSCFKTQYHHIRALEGELVRLRSELLVTEPEPRASTEIATTAPKVTRDPAAAGGLPVEIRDGLIVPSRSLAATGSLVPGEGATPALLYLNESVEIDHLSHNRWSEYFDFGGGEPYRRYRTVEPSRIDWNPATEQGRLIEHGRVEAV
jgi:hypothetical protein